ncbi:MAG: hypothetical protein IJR99_05445 [Kiritimatiellae bacterium]|nr:hypothetical protein [Kiritimatiellia bacterium]
MMKSLLLFVVGFVACSVYAWKVPSWDPRLTEAGAVQEFVNKTWCGHVQGMCANSNALYFAYHTQIVKTDWLGRLIKRVEVVRHTGDICLWNGKLYTALCHDDTGHGRGRIQVFDEDLNFIKETSFARPADGITCLNGVLYVGLGPAGTKEQPFRGNWYGKFNAETLEPLCEPFRLDHGYDCCAGVQNMTSDGTYIYANYYCPDETADTPCLLVFDKDMNVKGAHLFGWRQGLDVVPGGKDGAVRFIYCTTINWIGGYKHQLPVQALIQFAELKDGKIRDISRHCIFRTPLDR